MFSGFIVSKYHGCTVICFLQIPFCNRCNKEQHFIFPAFMRIVTCNTLRVILSLSVPAAAGAATAAAALRWLPRLRQRTGRVSVLFR